jgi:mannose-6-phosphate isomerase-like protein (cupin superfamily)
VGSEPPRRAYWLLSNLVIVHVSGDESDGRFSLVEFLMPPGEWTPLHVHREESQTTYVLEGEVTIHLPDGAHVLRPGDCIYQPAGLPQTEQVTSAEPGRVLDVNAPAGFDRFIAAAGRPAESLTLPPPPEQEPDPEQLATVASEYGIDILGPPGARP